MASSSASSRSSRRSRFAAWVLARQALKAPLHLQLVVDDVALPEETPGKAVVAGVVARVFRGDQRLVGSRQRLAIPTIRESDMPRGSATSWTLVDKLVGVRVVETHAFVGDDGVLDGVSFYDRFLDEPTAAPTSIVVEADALEPLRPPNTPRARDTLVLVVGIAIIVAVALGGFALAASAILRAH
jgi:hypothetical protein